MKATYNGDPHGLIISMTRDEHDSICDALLAGVHNPGNSEDEKTKYAAVEKEFCSAMREAEHKK